jgi:hypothetical protein
MDVGKNSIPCAFANIKYFVSRGISQQINIIAKFFDNRSGKFISLVHVLLFAEKVLTSVYAVRIITFKRTVSTPKSDSHVMQS